jgi:hypothetical protein
MPQYAIVDAQGNVGNIFLWDGTQDWSPPDGSQAVACDGTTAYTGGTYLNGVFSAPPPPPTPTVAQQGIAALAGGVIVASTLNPSLDGTYGCDAMSQQQVTGVVTYILLNGNFPGGQSTMPWHDMANNAHLFPDVATFKSFATQFANFVAGCLLYINSNGQIGGIPSNAITLP